MNGVTNLKSDLSEYLNLLEQIGQNTTALDPARIS